MVPTARRGSLGPDEPAPDFLAATSVGEIEFHRWKGRSWAFFLAQAARSTPVFVTEVLALAALRPELEKRGTKAICLSLDPVSAQHGRRREIEERTGAGVDLPLIADSAGSVAAKYGIDAGGRTPPRSLFVIDGDHVVRLTMSYPAPVGVDFAEALRALDAVQLADRFDVHTPAAWRPGGRVLASPALDDETLAERFGAPAAELAGLRYLEDPGSAAAAG